MQARSMSSCSVCPSVCVSVCLSVTFVHSVKINKHIFKIFSPPGSHTILVFHTKRDGDTTTGTPLTGASNAGRVGRNCDSEHIIIIIIIKQENNEWRIVKD